MEPQMQRKNMAKLYQLPGEFFLRFFMDCLAWMKHVEVPISIWLTKDSELKFHVFCLLCLFHCTARDEETSYWFEQKVNTLHEQ